MKKINFILLAALLGMLTSCGVGIYYPYAHNVFGAQTTVHLDKANFRVVRDVEAVVEVKNTNLSRSSVEKSAYGQLLRNAKLTGSQVLINVVIEEVQRASGGLFRWALGAPNIAQYVAARATIIEFLDEEGNPTISKVYRPATTPQSNKSQEVTDTQNTQTNVESDDIVTEEFILEDVLKQYQQNISKLDSYGWNKSVMYNHYINLVNEYKKENTNTSKQKIEVLNGVINKVLSNNLYKSTLEKSIKTAEANKKPIYDVFVSYYK